MFLGRVTGSVWSTVKWPAAKGLKLLLVRPYRLARSAARPSRARPPAAATRSLDDLVVCADLLDAGPGDDVLVAFGHAARVAVAERARPRPEARRAHRRRRRRRRRSRGARG